MRVLLTGGAGFIGSAVVDHLLRHVPEVEVLVNLDALTYSGNKQNLAKASRDQRHRFVHGSILDGALIAQLLREYRIGAVIHLAAETHVDRSIDSPEPFLQTNIMGTFRLLEEVRHYLPLLSEGEQAAFRFLHVSTDEVFGSLALNDPPFCETTAYDPHSPYSASKAAGDHLVRAYFYTFGLPVVLTNCSNNYGPRQFPEKLIPAFIFNALRNEPLPLYGDGRQRRDWLYVEDHARALALVLSSGRVGETYAIGGESERLNLEVVETICALLDERVPRRGGERYASLIQHVTDRPGHDRRYAISIDKIGRELGWKPLESLRSGLGKTVDWYLNNPQWYESLQERGYQRQAGRPEAERKRSF